MISPLKLSWTNNKTRSLLARWLPLIYQTLLFPVKKASLHKYNLRGLFRQEVSLYCFLNMFIFLIELFLFSIQLEGFFEIFSVTHELWHLIMLLWKNPWIWFPWLKWLILPLVPGLLRSKLHFSLAVAYLKGCFHACVVIWRVSCVVKDREEKQIDKLDRRLPLWNLYSRTSTQMFYLVRWFCFDQSHSCV